MFLYENGKYRYNKQQTDVICSRRVDVINIMTVTQSNDMFMLCTNLCCIQFLFIFMSFLYLNC